MDGWDRARVTDVALAAALAVASVVGVRLTHLPSARAVDAWAFGLAVSAAAVLALRRRAPVVTSLAVTAATSVYLFMGYPYSPILVSFFVAMYSLARHRPLRPTLLVGSAALLLLLVHIVGEAGSAELWVGLLPRTAWVVLPVVIGLAVRQNAEATARARAELVRQQVHDERMRMAQEVHDLVGHGLAAMKMQADVALHVLPKRPEQAEVALREISRTSAAALDELRATLTSFRHADEGRRPVVGLARLADLQQRMAHAGVRVHVLERGIRRGVPATTDLVAYRVVQESLTNVLRHTSASAATVTLTYGEHELRVEVGNTGDHADAPHPSRGSGLLGMRERVLSVGGEFSAGPQPEGGFRVSVALPLGGGS